MFCIVSCLFVVFIKLKQNFFLMGTYYIIIYVGVQAKLNKHGHFFHVLK